MVQPHSSISAVTMCKSLQLAAESVAPPNNANDVRRHILSTWEAMRDAITDANSWYLYTDNDSMWGAWEGGVGSPTVRYN